MTARAAVRCPGAAGTALPAATRAGRGPAAAVASTPQDGAVRTVPGTGPGTAPTAQEVR
ncbi:hypothetical protein [Streptomyces sp. NRRL F-5123]|uniref:hypothetical protein n=1 Tax=Streptomyces sp. NRRL F-5123 TaxID=1463856 RepID=UPI000ACEDD76|nr:hypothetical protein [Streptomyces sp. NRRL F-5123]